MIIVDDSKAEKTQKSAYKTINFAEIFRVQIAGEVQRLSDTPRQGGKSQSETDRLSSGAGTGGSRN